MKTLLGIIGVLAILGLSSTLAQPEPNQPPRNLALPPGVKSLKNLEYGRVGDRAMMLDLYLPEKNDKPRPLIIWIHLNRCLKPR
jgi:hypothetical protein